MKKKILAILFSPFLLKENRHGRLIMGEKHLFKLTLACWLALIGCVNPGWAADVVDRCQQLYKNGQYEQAFPVCSKAAKQGDAEAQYNLGLMYHFGEGISQDYTEAAKWYRKAAKQGYADAQYNLCLMYYNGKGVQQDYAEAAKWYRLGLIYQNGKSPSWWLFLPTKIKKLVLLESLLRHGTWKAVQVFRIISR
jgi:hypothetical protein